MGGANPGQATWLTTQGSVNDAGLAAARGMTATPEVLDLQAAGRRQDGEDGENPAQESRTLNEVRSARDR
jgi:hypothetical protein